MSRSFAFLLVCVLSTSFIIPGQAHAEIPRMISYQAKVTDSGGTHVADRSYSMNFRIFDAETGGTQKWESGTITVQVADGMFDGLLGESPQPLIMLHFDEDYWLEVTFDETVQSPRQRMTSTGYAYMASGLVPRHSNARDDAWGAPACPQPANVGQRERY